MSSLSSKKWLMAQHNDLGNNGEQIAVEFLKKKKYNILKTNYRYLRHEVDIIAQFGNELVAVEVKTRSTRDFGNPQDFVKPSQIKSIVTAVDAFMEQQNLDLEVRFDIIAILHVKGKFELEHIEDAFYGFI